MDRKQTLLMPSRSRKETIKYRKYREVEKYVDQCVFCSDEGKTGAIIEISKNFKIIKNIFPYSHWDSQGVADHLMIIPKIHTDTLADLNDSAAVEFVKLISKYESIGYNVYARAPQSTMKSIVHQHTHLIKLDGNDKKLLLYVNKPYLRLTK